MLQNLLYINFMLFLSFVLCRLLSNFIQQRAHLSVNHIFNPKQVNQSLLALVRDFLKTEQNPKNLVAQAIVLGVVQSILLLLCTEHGFSKKDVLFQSLLLMNFMYFVGTFYQLYSKKSTTKLSDNINLFISLNFILIVSVLFRLFLSVAPDSIMYNLLSYIYLLVSLSAIFLLRIWIKSIDFAWREWLVFQLTTLWLMLLLYTLTNLNTWLSIELLVPLSLLVNIGADYLEIVLPRINHRFIESYVLNKLCRMYIVFCSFSLVGFWWIG